ncbi:MAG: ABC transporter ATP-binding protein [Actinomycetota bacterium]
MSLRACVRCAAGDFAVDASIAAEKGRPVALVGPNGAGKTTVLRALAGLLAIDHGSVTLDETVLDDTEKRLHVPARARSVGVVFQDRALFGHLTVLENVAFGLRARGMRRSTARDRARAQLEQLGVGHLAPARPARLAGGEAQRVAIARALAHEPRLLLLDEPLSSLDVRARGEIRALLRRVLSAFDGVSVVVTHDPVDAMTLADDIVVLEAGRVTQSGTAAEIRAAPRTPYAAELVGLNLYAGRLEPLGDGAGTLRTPGGDIVVSWPSTLEQPLDDVIALVRPSDVSLFREQPAGSPRNAFRGRVGSIADDGRRARVELLTAPPVVAEVTSGSLERLGVAEGGEVWATFKAVEVDLLLPE